jgi:enolase
VEEAITTFRSHLAPRLLGADVTDQRGIDRLVHEVDGSATFGRIGGNTATAVSLAVALAHAQSAHLPLWKVLLRPGLDGRSFPAIVGNCMNGGRHAVGGPDIQEFIAYAEDPDPAKSIPAALAVHEAIGEALHARFPSQALGRGDEGGWVAPLGNLGALEVLSKACETVRDRTHAKVYPGLDLAASEFYRDGRYRYAEQTLDTEGQVSFLASLVDRFGLRYLEDPFQEEEFEGFARLTAQVGDRVRVVGDDLYCTAVPRVRVGLERRSSNAVLVKVNQVGTLSDALDTVDLCREGGLATVTSHRSGDLPEGWLAHVAVASGAAGLKCGLLGGERVAKLNELLRVAAAVSAS